MLPFHTAVALAGVALVTGEALHRWLPLSRRFYVPQPLLGGLAFALLFLLLRRLGHPVEMPTKGASVDFLVGLLTTNMGLHVSPRVLREGWRPFLLFAGLGAVLCVLQLAVVLPLALGHPAPLATAVLLGPLSYVGAPYNLNPPSQTDPVAHLFTPAYPELEETAQGMMMLGVLVGTALAAVVGRHLFDRAGQEPPKATPERRGTPREPLGRFAESETRLVILILVLIALAFGLQDLLLRTFSGLREGHAPVIVLGFLLGATVRYAHGRVVGEGRFPEEALTALLLGPTMGIVLSYAAMSVPLHHLARLTPAMALAGLLAVSTSAATAWISFPLFARLAGRYYAAVIATAFLGVTTGWGPIGMAYLRRFTDQQGPVEPMPVILPINAFYLFPWMVILLTRTLFALFG